MDFRKEKFNKNSPLVSVIMAVYNNEAYLSEAIESVFHQTYDKFELFLIDDGSTDNSRGIIKEFAKKDSRIICINNQKNLRQSEARNVAIRKSKGEYIAIVDSDDVCLPDRFEKQVAYLKKNNAAVDVLGSSYSMFLGDIENEYGTVYGNASDLYDGKPPVHNPTVMMKKKIFYDFGYYKQDCYHAEDYELWSRWAAQGVRFHNLPEILYKKRVHAGSLSITGIKYLTCSMLKTNFIALFKYHRKFTVAGYKRIFEQFFYLIYLGLRLDKVYTKSSIRDDIK